MDNILEIKNLSKSFKGFQLKNLNFALERGFIMGFIGPNGAGKSTTIKLIMNLLKRDSGEIKIFGKDNLKHEKEIKNKIGFVYDENHYYEELTVAEMKSVIAPLYKHWDETKGVFFSTHITSDLDKIADYITLINNGELIFSLQKDEVFENYSIIKGGHQFIDSNIRAEFVGLKENSFGFEGLTTNRNKLINQLGNKIIVEKPTLEDIILYHTKNRIGGSQYV